VEEHTDFVVKNEEEAKHRLRVEIGDLLHVLVKQNPDLKNWADSVQDCVYGMFEGEAKDSCKAVYSEHIGDETKHAVWRIVERILFTMRCKVIANQEADERIAKFRIRINDFETARPHGYVKCLASLLLSADADDYSHLNCGHHLLGFGRLA
jgi:hypothetical protein